MARLTIQIEGGVRPLDLNFTISKGDADRFLDLVALIEQPGMMPGERAMILSGAFRSFLLDAQLDLKPAPAKEAAVTIQTPAEPKKGPGRPKKEAP